MIYCQLLPRVRIAAGKPIRIADVAVLLGGEHAASQTVACPDDQGVWLLRAVDIAALLRRACPGEEVTLLGPEVCYIHRLPAPHADPGRPLRTAAAFAVLLIGSALGLAWFHSDVNMPRAMELVYALITGQEITQPLLITVPYIIGVALGVAVFYDVKPGRDTVTPLEVKLIEYLGDMERAEGREMPRE